MRLLEFTVNDNGIKNIIEPHEGLFAYKRSLIIIRHLIEVFGGKAEISCLEGVGTIIKFLVKIFWEPSPEQGILASHNKLAGKKIFGCGRK